MIHSTAVVDLKASIGRDVSIGPYCFIGPDVTIHDRVRIESHVVIHGHTTINEGVHIFSFASIGAIPQDLKYKGEPCYCIIGKESIIRESVTVNGGTKRYEPVTQVGERCLLMAYSHLGHNAVIGNEVIIANAGTLAGHVVIDDQAIIGGLTGIHQFVHIGKLTIIGGCSKVVQDVPPFMLADGNPLKVRSINKIGLQRKQYSLEDQREIKEAFRILYREAFPRDVALKRLKEKSTGCPHILEMVTFLENSKRGIVCGKKGIESLNAKPVMV